VIWRVLKMLPVRGSFRIPRINHGFKRATPRGKWCDWSACCRTGMPADPWCFEYRLCGCKLTHHKPHHDIVVNIDTLTREVTERAP